MTTMPRLTAAERREAVLEAASGEFAAHGYERTSTEKIAGVSGSRSLTSSGCSERSGTFSEAAVRRCLIETLEALERAAAGKRGKEALEAIAAAQCVSLQLVSPPGAV